MTNVETVFDRSKSDFGEGDENSVLMLDVRASNGRLDSVKTAEILVSRHKNDLIDSIWYRTCHLRFCLCCWCMGNK